MSSLIENLRHLQKEYKDNGVTSEILTLLEQIKSNPQCIFETNIPNSNAALMIIVNLMCHSGPMVDYTCFLTIKSTVLDFLIVSVNIPEISWFVNENCGVISILLDELQKQKDNNINSKILNCLASYLKFERIEMCTFGSCEESCCEFGVTKRVDQHSIVAACCSLVKLCLKAVNDDDIDGIDLPLAVLNQLYKQYNVQLSPDSCGGVSVYATFRHFLLSVFESKKYSPLCVLNCLSCFLHCRDSDSNKCFNETNGKFTLAMIYDIMVNCDQTDESSACLSSIAFLTEMLHQPSLLELVRREWTIDHFKTICKKFIGDSPACYYETILHFFLSIKDKIPEWNSCLQRFLHTNTKLFTFINKLTLHESDRCATLAWRLMKLYFKPSEITDSFSHEYLSVVTNSIKWNLEKAFIDDKYQNCPHILIGRRHLRSVKRALESCDFFLLLLDCEKLSDKLISICISAKIVAFIVALCGDLIDVRHNAFLSLQPYVPELLAPFLCRSNTWFVSGARLVVSLMFINVSMSQNYPDLVCTKSFEPILRSDAFTKLLALCMTHNVDNELIERSIALVTFCSHLSNYNISLMSRLMQVNNKFLTTTCRQLTGNSPDIVDRNLSAMMSSCASLTDTIHCNKHHENVDKMVTSWLNGDKSDFNSSETVVIFEDYIRSLKEHETFLEASVHEKDTYIRHCSDSIEQYRIKIRNSDSTLQRLATNIRCLTEASESKTAIINQLNVDMKDFQNKVTMMDNEVQKKTAEINRLENRCQESEEKLRRTSKDLEASEELNNELRGLLTKSESENKAKEVEIKRLTNITEKIEGLLHLR